MSKILNAIQNLQLGTEWKIIYERGFLSKNLN